MDGDGHGRDKWLWEVSNAAEKRSAELEDRPQMEL